MNTDNNSWEMPIKFKDFAKQGYRKKIGRRAMFFSFS
jgi:hypothetical protein